MSLHASRGRRVRGLRWRRVVAGCALALALLAGTGLALIEWRWTRRFDAPYPKIAASHDPAVIARGEYLVYSAAACAYCHVPTEAWDRLDQGERLPLTGHHLFRLPFGDIYSSNLTSDPATGIGRRTDPDLARTLRFGVRADGRAAFPLMEIRLSDEDLTAVASYLRAQAPTRRSTASRRGAGSRRSGDSRKTTGAPGSTRSRRWAAGSSGPRCRRGVNTRKRSSRSSRPHEVSPCIVPASSASSAFRSARQTR